MALTQYHLKLVVKATRNASHEGKAMVILAAVSACVNWSKAADCFCTYQTGSLSLPASFLQCMKRYSALFRCQLAINVICVWCAEAPIASSFCFCNCVWLLSTLVEKLTVNLMFLWHSDDSSIGH